MTAHEQAASDEDLVRTALSGDDNAFTELVSRHKRRVFGIVSRYADNRHELDDVCQEIFLKVYRNLRKFRGDAPFDHWVAKIAVNACYDLLRRRRRQVDEVPLEDVEFLLGDTASTEAPAEMASAILAGAMARLRPEERLVITLLELEERSVREVSSLTGWSDSKVKVRAFRARKELKRILEENDRKRSER
jgi:RNA polymerase sigma-70 factor (ECF subfamily)